MFVLPSRIGSSYSRNAGKPYGSVLLWYCLLTSFLATSIIPETYRFFSRPFCQAVYFWILCRGKVHPWNNRFGSCARITEDHNKISHRGFFGGEHVFSFFLRRKATVSRRTSIYTDTQECYSTVLKFYTKPRTSAFQQCMGAQLGHVSQDRLVRNYSKTHELGHPKCGYKASSSRISSTVANWTWKLEALTVAH